MKIRAYIFFRPLLGGSWFQRVTKFDISTLKLPYFFYLNCGFKPSTLGTSLSLNVFKNAAIDPEGRLIRSSGKARTIEDKQSRCERYSLCAIYRIRLLLPPFVTVPPRVNPVWLWPSEPGVIPRVVRISDNEEAKQLGKYVQFSSVFILISFYCWLDTIRVGFVVAAGFCTANWTDGLTWIYHILNFCGMEAALRLRLKQCFHFPG